MIISVVNQKGGVGKTTIAVNLAVCFARAGANIMLVDADKQGSALSFSTIRAGLPVPQYQFKQVLKPTLHQLSNNHDATIIDVGGSDSDVFRSGIYASDIIIMPLSPSSLDIWGSEQTLQIFSDANKVRRDNREKRIDIYGMLNMVVPNTTLTDDIREVAGEISRDYGIKFLKSELGARVIYKRAVNAGLGVLESRDPKAVEEITALYEEVRSLWQK